MLLNMLWVTQVYIGIYVYVLVDPLCGTLHEPMDCNPPGFSVRGIFQARILEWAAISFSRGSSRPRDRTQVYGIVDKLFTHLSYQGCYQGSSLSLSLSPSLSLFIYIYIYRHTHRGVSGEWQSGSVVKNLPANAGDAAQDAGWILGLGRSPGVGNSNLLQYSCLENFKDRGACGL